MARPLNESERAKRLAAWKEGGSVKAAAKILGITPGAMSRWMQAKGMTTKRVPEKTQEECIAALKAYKERHKKVPPRDLFNRYSEIGTRWKSHWPTWDDFLSAAKIYNDPAKILLLDIETAPNRAYFWGKTWNVNINPDWIDADGYVLCWTAKWLDDDKVIFHRIKNKNHKSLLDPIHRLLNEAHAVIHYNGTAFDIPTLQSAFLTNGFKPPSPYKQIDLLLTIRGGFNFPNNKLNYISKRLDLGEKIKHEGGPQLWLDCMKDKPEAWAKMEEYNRRDVELLEKLYLEVRPWIKQHPNRAAMEGSKVCPYCASSNIRLDKTYLASQLKYERYQCGGCGGWFRGTKSLNPRKEKRFALTS